GFVMKINPTGSALIYSSFLGGRSIEQFRGIAIDRRGNAYVTGSAGSPDFPTTDGAFQRTCFFSAQFGQCGVAFLAKVAPTGTSMPHSTYLGDGCGVAGTSVAVDVWGQAYVTGSIGFSNPLATITTTAGAFQTQGGAGNAWITKFNTTGSSLVYSTYL